MKKINLLFTIACLFTANTLMAQQADDKPKAKFEDTDMLLTTCSKDLQEKIHKHKMAKKLVLEKRVLADGSTILYLLPEPEVLKDR